MVPNSVMAILALDRLSVLALSSRFDGQAAAKRLSMEAAFQYSLCRVVLMVYRC